MRFQKGQSGNPGGRPKAEKEVKLLALKACPEVITILINIVKNAEDDRARIAAAKELLDRGIGKAVQAIEVTGADGGPLTTKHVDGPPQETYEQWTIRKQREREAEASKATGPH